MTGAAMAGLPALLKLLAVAALAALVPLAWWWGRQRGADARARLAALTAITLFLTFDLIAFGAFTRLTDSGLGCPDWPGCYGQASPLGARSDIAAAEAAMPTGPVTTTKAWIEMTHRYLAMVVGALILVAAGLGWRQRAALPHSPWWPTATLVWVIVQGLFGKYTVTLKLYPAVVTLHLLGGLVLLGLLVLQHESFRARSSAVPVSRGAVLGVLALLMVQVLLGGWVSTNYAVLACSGFPTCNGHWWPPMAPAEGFTVLRELGRAGHGALLSFDALVAIHMAHRLFALVAVLALGALVRALWRCGSAEGRRFGIVLLVLMLAQVGSGLSNVVLGWPIVAALAHSAGAAALVAVLVSLSSRVRAGSSACPSPLAGVGRPVHRI